MFKNQLQELAQRSCFNLPSYSCIREGPDHAPRFKATVNFNNETFESPMFCTTLRQAEHSAAEVALKELAKQGPSRSLAAKVLDELGVYKNLLQETVHRAGLNLPVYTTVRSGPGHVPVFHANVELAGMTFTGEPAKTKKQAQKNAAMAAWSTLKQMAHSQSSSSSSSSSSSLLSATDRNDEQEQAIITRFLSTFCPPDARKSPVQNDRNCGRQRSTPVRCDIKPTNAGVSLHHVQYPSWFYSNYSPEVAMYQMWQEQVARLQNRILTVPMAPSSMSGPQILPFIGSIYPSEFAQYFLAREQERMAVVPQITLPASGPTLHFSNGTIPLQIESRPQVVVQEIQEETTEGKENKLHGDASMDAGIKPPAGPLAHVSLHGGIPRGFDSSFHLQNPTSAGVAKSCPPSAAPLTIGSVAPVSTVNPRPAILNTRISSPVTIRPVIPTYSGRFRSMNTGGFRSVNCMAPAVQIRSVVPVCSAPPGTAREMPETTTQEGLFSGAERREDPKHVMAATSDLGKLKI